MNDSPTAATPTITLPVLDVVHIILEAGRPEVEVHTVHRHQLWNQIALCLLIYIFESVPVDETSALRGMGVEIHKHLQIWLAEHSLLRSQDRRKPRQVGFLVLAIQVLAFNVEPPVASSHSVGVEKWDYFKNVIVQQSFCLDIFEIHKLV